VFKYGFIMAGGQGKRLRSLPSAIPKPLLPVGAKPIIQFIIEHMKEYGINDIFISVNYKKEIVKSFLRDGSRYGVKLTYIEEIERTGTAGSLALLPEDFDDKILVSNGDLICDVDYNTINKLLSDYDLVLTGIEKQVPVDFGVLQMNGSSELVSWEEKPKLKYIINGGIYGVSKKVIGYIKNNIPRNQHIDMPTLWGIMKDNGMKLAVHIHRGKWHGVGRMEEYMALTERGEEIT
jgi:NDP-sugar pyrophosphorylase family protein